EAMIAAFTFIIAHALYKATLFLTTGIIDHETGTRDITEISGLRKVLFPVFLAGGLAALSSGGMPLFLGFIGKDLIYEATLGANQKLTLFFTVIAVITNICLVAAGFLAGLKPFMGNLAPRFAKIHLPRLSMWVPPLILAFLGLVLGIFPGLVGDYIVSPTVSALADRSASADLKIWHGFNTVLILSLLTLGAGAFLYAFNRPSNKKLSIVARFDSVAPLTLFKKVWKRIMGFSTWYSGVMHNGFLRSYMLKIIIFAELLLAYELFRAGPIFIDFNALSPISIYEAMNVFVLMVAIYLAVTTSSRLTAVVATSIVGFSICLMFVFYGAPDLAMTQFTIDTLTVVLFVFVLFNLPPFLKFSTWNKRVIIRDTIVALLFGILLSLVAIMALQVPTSSEISEFYGKYAYTMAKGKNVVNVILVDFRGFDTMFEIIVLSIAGLGVYSLLKLRLKSSEKE
ncbi:MAG TPA: hydrogen gas-evolving membrane-bound hydrogenase subunit E, partial [Arenibacter sp.]|nr:hydrogen gas-evolving membrane-bound hydrogenase subunit E [Arenibacter sp.]